MRIGIIINQTILLGLISLLWGPLSAVKQPSPPKNPQVASPSEKKTTDRASKYKVRVMVTLVNDHRFIGTLSLAQKKWKITHYKGQQPFELILRQKDIQMIRITGWKGVSQKDQASFYPNRLTITRKDNETLRIRAILPWMKSFRLQTNQGTSVFYSYYFDYRKNGRWENTDARTIKEAATKPLSRCVREILFLHR
jgi:hypothetical protein